MKAQTKRAAAPIAVSLAGIVAAVAGLLAAQPGRAGEFDAGLTKVMAEQVTPWLADPVVVDAIKAQNAETAGLDAAAIDGLDKEWRAQAPGGSGPLVDKVLGNDLSRFLKAKADGSNGLLLEIFVMDAKGLNVGQSGITSDYFQGDEAKWQKTYAVGPDGVLIDEVDFDDSAKAFVAQVSRTVVDPADGKAIGAVTVGINVEKLP
ncbi:PDC sensor domain-containing protein [Zavarzinia sp. CC-PAN008]|uniref:PDC sensor domain-containing protein n=1 Tax=Zavarzinia sp. CC-PAN008 TaxID=3243332 RepID=UPI003F7428DE